MFRERLRGIDILMAAAVVAGLAVVTPSFDAGDRMTQGVLVGSRLGICVCYTLPVEPVSRGEPACDDGRVLSTECSLLVCTAPGLWMSRSAVEWEDGAPAA